MGEGEGEKHTVAEKKVLPTADKWNMFKSSLIYIWHVWAKLMQLPLHKL